MTRRPRIHLPDAQIEPGPFNRNTLIDGQGNDRITTGGKNSFKRTCNEPQWSLEA